MGFKPPVLLNLSNRSGNFYLSDSYGFIACFLRVSHARSEYLLNYPTTRKSYIDRASSRRSFHSFFLSCLQSSSLHSDPPAIGLNRDTSGPPSKSRAFRNSLSAPLTLPAIEESRKQTVVRISLKSAKQHFGVSQSRGTRHYNEDTYQAGTINVPAFATKLPVSHAPVAKITDDLGCANDDPQVFCFGIFDGHGGKECSEFLRERLHEYVEKTAGLFEIESSLRGMDSESSKKKSILPSKRLFQQEAYVNISLNTEDGLVDPQQSTSDEYHRSFHNSIERQESSIAAEKAKVEKVFHLEKSLVQNWKDTVGGYFRRFKPEHFNISSTKPISIESVLMYAFLKADLDFVSAQANKPENMETNANTHDLTNKNMKSNSIGGPSRFVGGSTASIALISTPSAIPFWHPSSHSTMVVAHVGDTRIILCDTNTGLAKPCTTNHHPSSPGESNRLRRYSTTFMTDSFGEERMSGLANTRAFGDMHSKRIGVSAEPEIHRIELSAAKYSMLVLVSDGVSGTLSDQEIVDVIKEAKTPEQGSRDVVAFATDVSKDGDNATCLVVRLGGWEKRAEGGLGSAGTKRGREWRKDDAGDMRRDENHR
ncbi:putative protein phosphatase 2c domain containing protein [Golovinomyces cichoracearum]|uniref:PPM-type phosphatase domain-containing protein n=1 Tax=Golovinomyces cichoracearum TaxID=62708 RepID=A0A420I8B8_9PEZI|nr:putative protein phosphatase 2c domain containing protein [Golovinomyces cichoracearum]